VHGANRLGGNALADTQVFGKRAGEHAGKTGERMKKVDDNQIQQIQDIIDSFHNGSEKPAQIRTKLQKTMWQGAGIFRNAKDLNKTLEIVNELSLVPLKAESCGNIAECCIVRNMCLTASLICRSALIRTETRGAHVRVDIPQTYETRHSPFLHTFCSLSRQGIEKIPGAS
jgi:fumarate reductase (CoM/CoB) subunit A